MSLYTISAITVNDVTYYEKSTLIAVFIMGLICIIIGSVLLVKKMNVIFLKYKDSEYYDRMPDNNDSTDIEESFTEPDEQKLKEDERIFNELIKKEETDEEINELEYGPDDYVFGLSIRIFFVLIVMMFLAVGMLLIRFSLTAKDMDDYKAEQSDSRIVLIPPNSK